MLSLCLIAKNESRFIDACLGSVKSVADELVVVDTGSTDDTVARAEAAGARVHAFTWCDDFAAARNHALMHARGDWVLMLDADELLDAASAPRLEAALDGEGFDCGLVRLHNASREGAATAAVLDGTMRLGEPVWLPRVFRRLPDLTFRGAVHENVDAWLASRPHAPRPLDVDVVHLGAVPSVKVARGKSERNIRLLEKRWAEEPSDVMACGYLALEHLERGDLEAARRVSAAGWQRLSSADRGRSTLRLVAARCSLLMTDRDTRGVVDSIERARTLSGEHPDFSFLEGRAHELAAELATATPARQSALRRAVRCYRSALELAAQGDWRRAFEGASPLACRLRLATALLAAGQPADAAKVMQQLPVEQLPPEGLAVNAELHLLQGRPQQALQLLAGILEVDAPVRDGWLLAARCARALGDTQSETAFNAKVLALPPRWWAWHRA